MKSTLETVKFPILINALWLSKRIFREHTPKNLRVKKHDVCNLFSNDSENKLMLYLFMERERENRTI